MSELWTEMIELKENENKSIKKRNKKTLRDDELSSEIKLLPR